MRIAPYVPQRAAPARPTASRTHAGPARPRPPQTPPTPTSRPRAQARHRIVRRLPRRGAGTTPTLACASRARPPMLRQPVAPAGVPIRPPPPTARAQGGPGLDGKALTSVRAACLAAVIRRGPSSHREPAGDRDAPFHPHGGEGGRVNQRSRTDHGTSSRQAPLRAGRTRRAPGIPASEEARRAPAIGLSP